MKKLLILLMTIICISCNRESNKNPNAYASSNEETKNFDWLLGNWKRISEDTVHTTYENWKKTENTLYFGHGFVMKSSDTVWQERMVLSRKDTGWVLEVVTPGNNNMVAFGLTEYSKTSFMVENPSHDFPQNIKYQKKEDGLYAVVLGNEKKILFDFERVE